MNTTEIHDLNAERYEPLQRSLNVHAIVNERK
jgi:hypothetical protein